MLQADETKEVTPEESAPVEPVNAEAESTESAPIESEGAEKEEPKAEDEVVSNNFPFVNVLHSHFVLLH